MKRLLLVLLFPICVLPGCDSWLDIVPEEDMTTLSTIFETRSQAENWLRSCYVFLQEPIPSFSTNEAFVGADEYVAGDYANNYSTNYGWLHGLSISSGLQNSLDPYGDIWSKKEGSGRSDFYAGINLCNIFIERIDDVYNMEDGEKREWKAEVKALKAYMYFELVRHYGPIMLVPNAVDPNQDIRDLPKGYELPEGRAKPWGTAHAVLSARNLVDAPFCAINADDFYGAQAFELCYRHLSQIQDDGDLCMVGYLLKNTLSERGYVARGVCELDENSRLKDITERTHIISTVDGPMMTEDMQTYTRLSPDTVVSMNMWGFPQAMMDRIEAGFPAFLDRALSATPKGAEYFLPFVVDEQLRAGKARVKVYTTPDRWYGVTYHDDKPLVCQALRDLAAAGQYPAPLWSEG